MDDHRRYVLAPRGLAAAHCRSATVIESRCEELDRTDPDNAGQHSAMYLSAAMLRSFSIELALKSLRYAENATRGREHVLEALFRKQTPQTQNDIECAASTELARPFKDVLAEISDVFVRWRYVHEKFGSGEDLGFDTCEMKTIAHAVLQVLDERIQSTA